MTDVVSPPHLSFRDLVDTLRGAAGERRERWIRHLGDLCPECWAVLRRGPCFRLFTRHDSGILPDPLAYALCRLLAYHAPESHARAKADVTRALYPRHRDALMTAHERPLGLLRLALEESLVLPLPSPPVPWLGFTRPDVVRAASRLVPATHEKHPEARDDLEAWARAALVRAGRVSRYSQYDWSKEIVDESEAHLERAFAAAGRGTGNLLLRVTLHELRGLAVGAEAGIALLDEALGLLSSDTAADLTAVILLRKAKLLSWRWDEQAAICREALSLLGAESPPGLRVELLDLLGAAENRLGHVEAAWSAWTEAQRGSEQAGEPPLDYCRRWNRSSSRS